MGSSGFGYRYKLQVLLTVSDTSYLETEKAKQFDLNDNDKGFFLMVRLIYR